MGKIKQGILGGFSGKVAGVVGSSWKGINVMRAMPVSVANPRTTPQVAQRNKFSKTVLFSVQILPTIIKPLWDRFAVQMSGYNDFVSTNIDVFDETGLFEPDNLVISKGKMAAVPELIAFYNNTSQNFELQWNGALIDNYMSPNDLLSVVHWVTEVKDKVDGVSTSTARSEEEYFFTPDSTPIAGHTHWFWVAFKRSDGTIVSDTAVASVTIPA